MKAHISEQGELVITPESTTEQFAFNTWYNQAYIAKQDLARFESGHFRRSSLRVDPYREAQS